MNNQFKIGIKKTFWVLCSVFLISSCKNAIGNSSNNKNNIVENTPSEKKRGTAAADKSDDMKLQALLNETVDRFIECKYTDPQTGKTMLYNLFVPEKYDKKTHYPLVLFIADASTVGKGITVPLNQGYGGVIWASKEDQERHPSFVLVPQYITKAVDDSFNTSDEVEMTIGLLKSIIEQYQIDTDRIYSTGQSMGGMISMYLNITHPGLFAASIYVGCQWDTSKMGGFANDKFFYIVAAGDEKAPKGMANLKEVLEEKGVKISSMEWSAKLPEVEQESMVKKLLSDGNKINFITFTKGSVLPENGKGNEHMNSFDYAYKLTGVRDWLFMQKK